MSQCGPIQLSIPSNAQSLPVVRSAVERMALIEGFDEQAAHTLTWAIDEALANVIKHGYGGKPDQPIEITLSRAKATDGRVGLEILVRDRGRVVDPATIKSRDLAEVRPGGLGVHIIKSVMDEVEYRPNPDIGMRLRMVKYLNVAAGECADAASNNH